MWLFRQWRAIALIAALAGVWHVRGVYDDAVGLRATVAAQNEVIEKTKKVIRDVNESAKQDDARAAVLAADLAATDGQLDRLRADLAAIASGDGASVTSADARRIADLFADCAGEVVRLAGEADRLAAKVTGLQGYVRAIGAGD